MTAVNFCNGYVYVARVSVELAMIIEHGSCCVIVHVVSAAEGSCSLSDGDGGHLGSSMKNLEYWVRDMSRSVDDDDPRMPGGSEVVTVDYTFVCGRWCNV